ncbi:hypothetical protein ACWEOH_03860 [Agromyces sp. NPDC004153]
MDTFSDAEQWRRARFGDSYDAVLDSLRMAAMVAHQKGVDAKDGSGLPSDDNYGVTYWQILLLELMTRLRSDVDVREVRLNGGRYPLPEINGTTILAARAATGSGPNVESLRLKRSKSRDLLLGKRTEFAEAAAFDFSEWLNEEIEVDFPGSEADAVVMAVVVAGPRTGVTRIYIGDGYLSENGTVVWGYVEQVALAESAQPALQLAGVQTNRRFNELPADDDLDIALHGDGRAREARSQTSAEE